MSIIDFRRFRHRVARPHRIHAAVAEALEPRGYLSVAVPSAVHGSFPADDGTAPVFVDDPQVSSDPTFYLNPVKTFTVGQSNQVLGFAVTSSAQPTLSVTPAPPAGVILYNLENMPNDFGMYRAGVENFSPLNAAVGTYHFVFAATSQFGSVSEDATLYIDAATTGPTITSAGVATITPHQTFLITTTGTPNAAIDVANLPNGVLAKDNGNGTATISLDPAASLSPGVSNVTVTANNGTLPNAVQTLALTIAKDQAPAFTSPAAGTLHVSRETTDIFTISASGMPAPAINAVGLPTGVGLNDTGTGTATLNLSGSEIIPGVYPITLHAKNGVTPNAVQKFILTITGVAPMITSPALATLTSNQTLTITATGDPTPVFRIPENLPPGIVFARTSLGTATFSLNGGTTGDVTPPGVSTINLVAKNGISPNARQTLSLTIVGNPPVFTSAANATFQIIQALGAGIPQSFTISASGTPNIRFEADGLPTDQGIGLTDNNDGTATLDGTPHDLPRTGNTLQGIFKIKIDAFNDFAFVSQDFTLQINQAPFYVSPKVASAIEGFPDSLNLTVIALGYPTPTFGVVDSSTLPQGISAKVPRSEPNVIKTTGTPTQSGGDFSLSSTAGNGISPDANQTVTIVVFSAPDFTSLTKTTFNAAAGSVAPKIVRPFAAQGGTNTFTVTTTGYPIPKLKETGALPPGVTFVDNRDGTATLSGTPTTVGSFPLTFKANNGRAPKASQAFILKSKAAVSTSVAAALMPSLEDSAADTLSGNSACGAILSDESDPPNLTE